MLRICISFFAAGVVLGLGPCLVSCGPLLVAFITGNKNCPREGLLTWLNFSLGRILSYVVLTLLIGLAGQFFVYLFQVKLTTYLYLAAGIFILMVGSLTILGKGTSISFCAMLNKFFIEKGVKSSFLLGLFLGFLPCAPFIGILSYIALISRSWFYLLVYSLAFGLGTLVSPLLILATGAGFVSRFLSRNPKFFLIMRLICGLAICALGINLLVNFYLIAKP